MKIAATALALTVIFYCVGPSKGEAFEREYFEMVWTNSGAMKDKEIRKFARYLSHDCQNLRNFVPSLTRRDKSWMKSANSKDIMSSPIFAKHRLLEMTEICSDLPRFLGKMYDDHKIIVAFMFVASALLESGKKIYLKRVVRKYGGQPPENIEMLIDSDQISKTILDRIIIPRFTSKY